MVIIAIWTVSIVFFRVTFDNAVPTVFINHDEILNEIKDIMIAAGDKKTVFHAGEL